jgi:hypothetical protein
VLFSGRAQERTAVFRTEKRRNPVTGATYPWIVRSTAMVNHLYIYEDDFTDTRCVRAARRCGARACRLSSRAGMSLVRQVELADPPVRENAGRVTIAPGTSATREFG